MEGRQFPAHDLLHASILRGRKSNHGLKTEIGTTMKVTDKSAKAIDKSTETTDKSTKAIDKSTKATEKRIKATDISTKATDNSTKATDNHTVPNVKSHQTLLLLSMFRIHLLQSIRHSGLMTVCLCICFSS